MARAHLLRQMCPRIKRLQRRRLCKQQDIAGQFAESNEPAGACYLTLIQTAQDLLSSGQPNTALAITEAIDAFVQCSRVVFQEAFVPETCRNCHLDDLYCRFNAFLHPSGACYEACGSADDIDACNACQR